MYIAYVSTTVTVLHLCSYLKQNKIGCQAYLRIVSQIKKRKISLLLRFGPLKSRVVKGVLKRTVTAISERES